MKITAVHIGMRIKHPQYGEGVVKGIAEHTIDVTFDDGKRIIDPEASDVQPCQPHVAVTGLETSLRAFVDEIVAATVEGLGLEKPDFFLEKLGQRWHGGKLVMHPADAALQTKDVPIEVFFHKIVMMRNNLRVLEQKVNAHPTLNDSEKIEMQQYITRCYGSMTTFNILFRTKEDQFGGA